jgi:hypothetical protein
MRVAGHEPGVEVQQSIVHPRAKSANGQNAFNSIPHKFDLVDALPITRVLLSNLT